MAMPSSGSSELRELIDIHCVSREYLGGASIRHARRLADSGLMPWGIKLGALRRWRRAEMDAWVASGCPPVVLHGRTPSQRAGSKGAARDVSHKSKSEAARTEGGA